MAKASGKAAIKPRPPSTSQVSLPSQIGAIEFMIGVARRGIRRKAVEHADTEIEAVEQDVEEHRHAEDQRPDRNEIENLAHGSCPPPTMRAGQDRRLGPSGLDGRIGLFGDARTFAHDRATSEARPRDT